MKNVMGIRLRNEEQETQCRDREDLPFGVMATGEWAEGRSQLLWLLPAVFTPELISGAQF